MQNCSYSSRNTATINSNFSKELTQFFYIFTIYCVLSVAVVACSNTE